MIFLKKPLTGNEIVGKAEQKFLQGTLSNWGTFGLKPASVKENYPGLKAGVILHVAQGL
jgi:hypothetical protein